MPAMTTGMSSATVASTRWLSRPLSHPADHTAGRMSPISIGAESYFAAGAHTLAANLLEARPTIMTAVPRLYETMHQRLRRGILREHGLKRKLLERAVIIRPK